LVWIVYFWLVLNQLSLNRTIGFTPSSKQFDYNQNYHSYIKILLKLFYLLPFLFLKGGLFVSFQRWWFQSFLLKWFYHTKSISLATSFKISCCFCRSSLKHRTRKHKFDMRRHCFMFKSHYIKWFWIIYKTKFPLCLITLTISSACCSVPFKLTI
jgi:hypothetical protein